MKIGYIKQKERLLFAEDISIDANVIIGLISERSRQLSHNSPEPANTTNGSQLQIPLKKRRTERNESNRNCTQNR